MRIRHCLVATLLLLVPLVAQAASLSFGVSNNMAQAAYAARLTDSGLYFNVQGLHNTDHGDVFGAGVDLVSNANPGGSPVTAGIGLKGLWLNPNYHNVGSGEVLAVGGHVNFNFPAYNRVGVSGSLYYAPKVISFGNARRYLGLLARVHYRVLRNASVYVGWNYVTGKFRGTDNLIIDNGLNVGIAMRF